MLITLLDVVLPVFLVVGSGYLLSWRGFANEAMIDGLTKFAQNFAIPCLLFSAMAKIDLTQSFSPPLLTSFYTGAVTGFLCCFFGARILFKRSWEDAVAIGFIGLFSNTVLLGLPITERAYGPGALVGNFAIISVHAPICYLIGITTMEIVRNRGARFHMLAGKVVRGMFSNAIIIGIALGIAVNLSGLSIPGMVEDWLSLISLAALPTALFGLGGVLYRYRPQGDMRVILFVVAVSLLLHPFVTYTLAGSLNLSPDFTKSAVVNAAMAPGVNTYLFATLYGRAQRVAATSVLLGTGISILTGTGWLWVLG